MNLPFIYLMNRLPSTSYVRLDISSQIVLQAPHSRSRGPKSRCFALLGVKVVITSVADEDSDHVGKTIGSTLSGCDATSIVFCVCWCSISRSCCTRLQQRQQPGQKKSFFHGYSTSRTKYPAQHVTKDGAKYAIHLGYAVSMRFTTKWKSGLHYGCSMHTRSYPLHCPLDVGFCHIESMDSSTRGSLQEPTSRRPYCRADYCTYIARSTAFVSLLKSVCHYDS